MAEDQRAEPTQPEGKPTAKMEAVPPWAVALTMSVKDGFAATEKRLDTLAEEGQRTNLRLTRQEVRMDDVETRLANNSMRAAQPSKSDLALEAELGLTKAALAEEKVKRETLESKAVTQEDLAKTTAAQTQALIDELKKNPIIQKVIYAVGGAVLAYLASKGIHVL